MSVLITYFSTSGITRQAASRLASLCNGTLFEIEPAVPYTDADLDWMDKNRRSTLEMKNPENPVATQGLPDLNGVDTLLVGFPIWWYRQPSIVDSFLKELNAKGIKAAAFATSGGSSIDKADRLLASTFPALEWKASLRITPSTSDAALASWLNTVTA